MRRIRLRAVSALIGLLAVLPLALPVQAVLWCKTDPVVRLNGTQVHILVALPEEYVPYVTGPTEVEIKTPKGVVRELLFTDPGFNGHGEVVHFNDLRGTVRSKTFPTEIRVKVPIDKGLLGSGVTVPVQVEVIPDNALPVVVLGTSDLTMVKTTITGR